MLHLSFLILQLLAPALLAVAMLLFGIWRAYQCEREWRKFREEREREDEPHGFGHVDDDGGAA